MKILRLLLAGLLLLAATLANAAQERVELHLFWSRHCPHCLRALPQLQALAEAQPWLHLQAHEISESPENLALFRDMAAAHEETALAVPTLFYCGQMEVGWDDDPAQGERLLARLAACRQGQALEAAVHPGTLALPLLGEVDLARWSLPLLTVLLAGFDAFNPCAFFVLLFLLSLLTHQHRRRRMLLIGGIFVAASGLLYFAFMAAWLKFFLIIGSLPWVTLAAGLAALLAGALNIKDFFAFRQGLSLSIGEPQRADLIQRSRRLLLADKLPPLLAATILLATAANFYELLCTAGFPMVFTRLLTLRVQGSGQHYLYLLLYNLIYVLPLLAIVIAFARTLGARRLSEREGRLLKLLSGLLMSGLGLLLVLAPEQLETPQAALLLPLAAGLLTWLAAGWTAGDRR